MKSFFFLLTLSLCSGCGVKAPPLKDPEVAIDSYIRSYTQEDDGNDQEKDAKKETTPSPPVIK